MQLGWALLARTFLLSLADNRLECSLCENLKEITVSNVCYEIQILIVIVLRPMAFVDF